ncbi:Lrp/AsnC family transcriptional regulator [Halococcus agarilyticus]|uniref:Lrp/AsnC family transcriptional regulator n=1 Tax=Halococcus agarilyticus TaxID=1232219 RepID=UPI000677788D|nr:Lrp/AsnC family transcriptional regulator [Halococcus agarilyticus]
MAIRDLDALDGRILHALQEDGRHTSSSDIAASLDVSASTVRNRIQRLESDEVISGYHADVDYEAAGFQLYTLIVCTAPIPEREELAAAAADVPGVVEVQEVMTGEANVLVRAIGVDGDDLSRIGEELDELGLGVSDEDLIRNTHRSPYSGFESQHEE